MTSTHPVVVIGGGQAGLAAAYQLGRRGVEATVLDAASSVGESWRRRWDSLRLFTPAVYSSLPGLAFPARADHYPAKDEVADYLATYAARFDLDVRHGITVTAVTTADGRFRIASPREDFEAGAVVIATGPFQTPTIPALADGIDQSVVQLHSSDYRNPDQLPDGAVLVVGGGNSGCQIADELVATGREVHLAVGQRYPVLPPRVAGRSLFHWLDRTGYLGIGADTRIGRRLQRRDTIIGTGPRHLRGRGVRVHGRLTGATGDRVLFAGVTAARVDAVIWATGFRLDHSFVQIPRVLDANGVLRHRAGHTDVPGLHAVGQPWQRNRGSALLGFVGTDAALIADHIAARTSDRRPVTA